MQRSIQKRRMTLLAKCKAFMLVFLMVVILSVGATVSAETPVYSAVSVFASRQPSEGDLDYGNRETLDRV